jgi:hypothetical protein
MNKKSNEPFVFGDLVRTIDGCGPVMMVTDASPSHQPACTILCQCWVVDGLQEIAIHAGLLESCEARPLRVPPKPLFERLSPLLTMLVEAVDLWASVESGRSEVVKVPEYEADGSASSDVKNSGDELADCRTLWCEVFGGKAPLAVFNEYPPAEEREKILAMRLSLNRSSFREHRPVVVAELELLMDFALRCGHQLDRRKAVDYLNRILDARIASGADDVTGHQREVLCKGDSYCGHT